VTGSAGAVLSESAGPGLAVRPSPRVTVAIPTLNRARSLADAVASVQAQDFASLEILVGDNASSDDTRDVCAALAGREPRLRFRRREARCGPFTNFRSLLEEARGEFFMWLGDDDRLGPGYLHDCVAALSRLPDHSAVAGRTLYSTGESAREEGRNVSLESDDPRSRVLEHYARVLRNELFYGLMRSEAARRCPLREVVGGDWHFVAALAFSGKIRTLEGVHLQRELGGTSESFERIIAAGGLPSWHARVPYLLMAAAAFAEIAWRTRAYRELGVRGRLLVGARAASIVAWRGRSHDFQALGRARRRVVGWLHGGRP
jgi:glycosyltransferase involved in cell wall biosynthesis